MFTIFYAATAASASTTTRLCVILKGIFLHILYRSIIIKNNNNFNNNNNIRAYTVYTSIYATDLHAFEIECRTLSSNFKLDSS